MLNIRPAAAHECEFLSQIAYKSEAYWGYDAEYMEKFRSVYRVTEDSIRQNRTYVAENHDQIIGFYALSESEATVELEYFFIEPEYIGQGYGKRLWNHLVQKCGEVGIGEFEIVTSPQAREFYVRLGATVVGEVESYLKKGRMIPKLIYYVCSG